MTARDMLLLCYLAHLDLPPLYISALQKGSVPIRALADYALRMDRAGMLKCVDMTDGVRAAADELARKDGVITGYINENPGGGFVAYTLDIGGTAVVAMRGSEREGECVASNVDWVDNVCEPFTGSVQLSAIRDIVRRFNTGSVIFTGHSKGGHNALLALAVSENPDARAYAFNGQGFSAGALSAAESARLRERGVNYVVADDPVGALLAHPEKRVFVRHAPGTNAHMPEAFVFDESGAPVTAARAVSSRLIEIASRAADKRLGGRARSVVSGLCRTALNSTQME